MDTLRIPVRIGKSRIHRKGLFAARDIKGGTRIIQYIGEKISREEGQRRLAQGNVYIFYMSDLFDIDGKTLKNTARYINHACDPNCYIETTSRTIWIVAARNIQKGEELSYNYRYELDKDENHPCNCGAENCCGYILDPKYWEMIERQ
jgi:SET domain-containing protein